MHISVRGSWTAIMGPSGSGKSTFLYCISGLLKGSEGAVVLDGTNVTNAGSRKILRLYRDKIGFIFQQFNLLEAPTAKQNVMLSSLYSKSKITDQQAEQSLAEVGLADYVNSYPSEMSGGNNSGSRLLGE